MGIVPFLSLTALAACNPTHEPTVQYLPERLAVHSVLVVGDTLARVLVTRVGGRAGSAIVPVTNAIVRLTSGNETVQLAVVSGLRCIEAAPVDVRIDYNDGCYAARFPAGLRTGVTYTLHVNAAQLGSADGTVTLRAPPAITTPVAGARLPSQQGFERDSVGGIAVRWAGVSAGSLVEVSVRQPNPQCTLLIEGISPFFPTNAVSTTATDSLRVRIFDGSCTVGDQGYPAEIVLLAFDTAYTQYIENLNLGTAADPNSVTGISGAVGVFAGAARAAVPIILTHD